MTKCRMTAAMGSLHTGQLKPALCRPRLEWSKGGGMQSETSGRARARTLFLMTSLRRERARVLLSGPAGRPEQAGQPPGRRAAAWAASKR
eukprot:scaffold56579_cov54-Phaeocystis_antarctica.AAC.1